MIVLIELVILCAVFFLICFAATGTDDKNLRNFATYPDEVQARIRRTAAYRGKYREGNKTAAFLSNFLLFSFIFLLLGLLIRERDFVHNFLCLSILGQGLSLFDLLVIDLIWWRNTGRIRLAKIPDENLYKNPRKHVEAFARAFVMYLLIALIDGYLLTLL